MNIPKNITIRECEVWCHLASGRVNKEIADKMGISPKTVQHQRASLYKKLGVHHLAGAIVAAIKAGIVK